MQEGGTVRLHLPAPLLSRLRNLPWHLPLEKWKRPSVRFIEIRSGLSRHVVRFVERKGMRFAIKETSFESAVREYDQYLRLRALGIPTLEPLGVVRRSEGIATVPTIAGRQYHEQCTGYLITAVMEHVVPDSFLFRRGFSTANRRRIWDAIIRLFVEMHLNGVYWGDASLANMLILFGNEHVPGLGQRTHLTAVLADAETVELHPVISPSLRNADVGFFLESMQWTEADLRASGVVRDPVMTRDDLQYVLQEYTRRIAVEQEMRSFELVTLIDVDRLLGNFDVAGYGALLLRHIHEHKWFVSERLGKEISLEDAAGDWYREVFKPVCRLFKEYGLPDFFPEKTAASLYVEIMEHKYFMSQHEGRDVGLVRALNDYATRFTAQEPLFLALRSLGRVLATLLRRAPVACAG